MDKHSSNKSLKSGRSVESGRSINSRRFIESGRIEIFSFAVENGCLFCEIVDTDLKILHVLNRPVICRPFLSSMLTVHFDRPF